MNDSTIAAKLRGQLVGFLGRISPRFRKPTAKFVGDMVYGLVARGDVKLSSVVRALDERTSPKKVEDRLSRMLASEGLAAGLHDAIAAEGARRIRRDTIVVIDPSDVRKPYARKMEYLAKVWDGSRGDVGENLGCHGCMAVACESGGRRPVPLHLRLWSADAPGFRSGNDEVEKVVDAITAHAGTRGVYVYDRGGDGIGPCRLFLRKGLDFIVRLKERHVRSWRRDVMCGELAWQCRMPCREVVKFDSHGRERKVTIEFGVVPVRLPDIPDRLLHMVVVRGFGKSPMMLLTTLARTTTRESLWQAVQGYMTRWRVEDTIRHVKQSCCLEDVRLFKYEKLRNMAAIVLAAVCFSMAWIGNSDKHAIIAESVARMSLRLHGVPEFHFCAIADGARAILSRSGRWRGVGGEPKAAAYDGDLFSFFAKGTG